MPTVFQKACLEAHARPGREETAAATEDCKLVGTCKMQNRNATDKLIQQCSKLALFANTITDICCRMTMLVYYIVDSAYQLHFYFAFCM